MSTTKPTFSPDLPVPDTAWNIMVFIGMYAVVNTGLELAFSAAEPLAFNVVLILKLLGCITFVLYSWKKRQGSLSQKYQSLESMTTEERNKLVQTQADYFRYQLRVSYLIGFWGTVIPVLLSLFFFTTSPDYHFLSASFLSALIFCWALTFWRVAMELYYLRKLERTQQPV